ncbi:MerR family transcriptional regulator [Aeromicrobium sp. UC242_57]|uniref:transcriptional regulator FtsR n=1 Tax=Aeromicrobium sp. UC242_57 TaxID=3374624 RepID=UPI0037AEDDA5
MTQPLPALSRLGIGKVLDELLPEFGDLTITKIRYLESEGLLEPERTPSGYRKFSFADVERLRFILRQQRDKFWPLSHIRQVLDDMDRGQVPDTEQTGTTRVPRLSLADDGLPTDETFLDAPGSVRLSRDASGVSRDHVRDARGDRAVWTDRSPPLADLLRRHLVADRVVGRRVCRLGLEPRHLKMFSAAADREVALFEQVVTPRSRQLDKEATDRTIAGLAALSIRFQSVLVRSRLRG